MKRALARYLTIAIGSAALITGGVELGHTASGRAVTTAVTRMAHGGCPFGYDKPMSPAQRERASSNFAATHRGERRAVSRPALGFVLDHTTRTEVIAHFASYGVTCAADKGFSDLTCNAVPSAALGGSTPYAPPRNVWFTFGTKQQLLSVTAFSRAPGPRPISDAFVATRVALGQQAGTISATQGDADAANLAGGLLRQASAEFRFSDYYARERATNMGKGFMLTEEYRSLAD
jgi:hypothetical protein